MDMSWIETSLSRLEYHLRKLFEGNPAADGFPHKLHRQLEHALLSAMHTYLERLSADNPGVSIPPPDEYTLRLPSHLAEQLLNHPQELDLLSQQLAYTASQAGYPQAWSPVLRVVADPLATQVSIVAACRQPDLGFTHTSALDGKALSTDRLSAAVVPDSFLIVNGLSTFPINGTVVNLGRDPSNQVRIDDPRVSRLHAQIRLVQGHHMIFDLDSEGGTSVNGIHAASHLLNPGDVISLAGVPLVYGQELGLQHDYTQEVPPLPQPPIIL
jgi:hypothetical protein